MKGLTWLQSKYKKACTLTAASLFLVPLIYSPFFHHSFTSAKELTFKVLILLAVFAAYILSLKANTLRIRTIGDSVLFLLLLAEVLVHALSNFLSDTPLVALYGTYSRGGGFIFELYLFGFLLWNALFLSRSQIQVALKALWWGACLVALYGLLQKLGLELFFQNYSTNLFQGRIFSFLGNPSLLGQFMLLGVFTGLYLSLQEKKQKIIWISGTLILLAALVLSGTRAAVLSLLVMSVLSAFRFRRELWIRARLWKWKLAAVVPLFLILLWAAPSDRFSFSNLSLRSLESRFEIWEGTLELIQDRWLLGYGQETFYIYFPEIVSKEFLTLEEDLNISADRVHNEWLEEMFNHGILAGLLYLVLIGLLLRKFFTSSRGEETLLAALLLGNAIQNQLAFPDPSILVVTAFAWGGLIALESKEVILQNPLFVRKQARWLVGSTLGILLAILMFQTVVRPAVSQRLYTIAQQNKDYELVVNSLKGALAWTPYYSELWYELMFIDPSSMERALQNLKVIDGESGDWLAWNGNYYAESDPQLSAEYFLKALEKNPYHPNWLRAFGDMLYANSDCETALFVYSQYVEAVPDYWKWTVNLESYSESQQKSYETFFKHAPYFFGTLEKMEECQLKLDSAQEGV